MWFGMTTFLLVALAVVQGLDLRYKHPWVSWGTIPEAFAAVGTVVAVGVAVAQSLVISRQAAKDAVDTAKRFEAEIAAAEIRHQAELQHQRDLADLQQSLLQKQEQRRAIVEVARAAFRQQSLVDTLWQRVPEIYELLNRQDRADAVNTISEQVGLATASFTVESNNAIALFINEDDGLMVGVLNDVSAAVDKLRHTDNYLRKRLILGEEHHLDPNDYHESQLEVQNSVQRLWMTFAPPPTSTDDAPTKGNPLNWPCHIVADMADVAGLIGLFMIEGVERSAAVGL